MDSSKNVSGHWTHSFNPQWLNDLSFGYVHTTSLRGAPDMLANRNLAPDFGIKNTTTEPDCYAPPGPISPALGIWELGDRQALLT